MHRITNARRRLSSSSDKYANRTLSLVELESSQLRSALLHPNQPQDNFAQPPQTLQISALHLIQAQQQSGASMKKKLRKSVSVLPSKKAASFASQAAPYPNVTSQRSKNKTSIDPPMHGVYLSPKYPPKAPVMTSRQPQVCVGNFMRKQIKSIQVPQMKSPPKASSSAAPPCGKSSQKVINLELDLNLKGGNLDDVVISSVHAEVSTSPSLEGESPVTKKAVDGKVSRKHVTVPIQVNFRRSWNYMSKEEKENLVERLSDKISTMTLQVRN